MWCKVLFLNKQSAMRHEFVVVCATQNEKKGRKEPFGLKLVVSIGNI